MVELNYMNKKLIWRFIAIFLLFSLSISLLIFNIFAWLNFFKNPEEITSFLSTLVLNIFVFTTWFTISYILKRRIKVLGIATILSFLLFFVASFSQVFYCQKKFPSSSICLEPIKTEEFTSTPTTEPKATPAVNYINKNLGFEFEYSDFLVIKEEDDSVSFAIHNWIKQWEHYEHRYNLTVSTNPEDFVNYESYKLCSEITDLSLCSEKCIDTWSQEEDVMEITIGEGIKARSFYLYSCEEIYHIVQVYNPQIELKMFLSTGFISEDRVEEIFSQILSTFNLILPESQFNKITHIAPENLSFDSFELLYPSLWELKIGDVTINEDNFIDKEKNLFLYLFKDNSLMKINSSAFGRGGCLFPGEPDKDFFGRFGEYKDIRVDEEGIWRRAESLNEKNAEDQVYTIYVICHRKIGRDYFDSSTPVGGIKYKIYPGEEELIDKFDQIVKDIKILQ